MQNMNANLKITIIHIDWDVWLNIICPITEII